ACSRRCALRPERGTSGRRRAPGLGGGALPTLRGALAEQALGPEDEDRDQDPEDDRAGPVTARRPQERTLVHSLDHPDDERAENGAVEVADAAEHSGRKGDQAELEARVVADVELDEE